MSAGKWVLAGRRCGPEVPRKVDALEGDAKTLHFPPDAFRMGVGDKQLTIIPETDPVEQVAHAILVQLLEYIVQQEDGGPALGLFERLVFSQFEGEEQAFALTLGGPALKW